MSAKKAQLLLVDDEPGSIEALCRVLEDKFELFIATDGATALQICRDNPIELVLMDVDLPDMSGFMVAKKLKKNRLSEQKSSPVIIFISGYDDLIFEIQAFEAGAVDYLSKPVSPLRVLVRINVHLKLGLALSGSLV